MPTTLGTSGAGRIDTVSKSKSSSKSKSKSKSQSKSQRRSRAKRQSDQRGTRRAPMPTKTSLPTDPNEGRPIAWADELLFDRAIWEPASRDELSAEDLEQVLAVSEALKLLANGQDPLAGDSLRRIPRKGVGSDWRMLVRGLGHWYAREFDDATRCWERLDAKRRPYRIAQVLQASSQPVPSGPASIGPASIGPASSGSPSPDDGVPSDSATSPAAFSLEKAVERLQQLLVERPGLLEAKELVASRPKNSEIGAFWRDLRLVVQKYRETEPALSRLLHGAAVAEAFGGENSEAFSNIVAGFRGPSYDPSLRVLRIRYELTFILRNPAEILPKIREFAVARTARSIHDQQFCKALASALYGRLALRITNEGSEDSFVEGRGLDQLAERACQEAVDLWPQNERAFAQLMMRLGQRLAELKPGSGTYRILDAKIATLSEEWLAVSPNSQPAAECRITQLLRDQRFDDALALAEPRAAHAPPNSELRNLHWHCVLQRTLSFCRDDERQEEANTGLDEVERTWPEWLSRDFLKALRYAMEVRSGKRKPVAKDWRAILSGERLAPDLVALAAMHNVGLPEVTLQKIVASTTKFLSGKTRPKVADRFAAGRVMLELERLRWSYPSLEEHQSLLAPLLSLTHDAGSHPVDDDFEAAFLWLVEFAPDCGPFRLPSVFTPKIAVGVIHVAVSAHSRGMLFRLLNHGRTLAKCLEEGIKSETDPFFLTRYEVTLIALETAILPMLGGPFGMGFYDDDDDYDEYDDDDEYEEEGMDVIPDEDAGKRHASQSVPDARPGLPDFISWPK
jgi:hypothetical protein